MPQSTSENIRYHAAGHLAAAELIARDNPRAAAEIIAVVLQFAEASEVDSPPALLDLLRAAHKDPAASITEMKLLENWFCHPLNTIIEQSGTRF